MIKELEQIKQTKKLMKKLNDTWGPVSICNNCGNIVNSEGYTLGKDEMGNNYSYIEIRGKTYHFSVCECGKAILLGGF
jgi:hypothetical protein